MHTLLGPLQGCRWDLGSTEGVLNGVTNRLVCLGQRGSQDMGLTVLKPGKFWQTRANRSRMPRLH